MEEGVLDVVDIIDYTDNLLAILHVLEGIKLCLESIYTLLFLGSVVITAVGLVYMMYSQLRKFM